MLTAKSDEYDKVKGLDMGADNYRVNKSRSKKTDGTGLGLSIVKHIVESHGGKTELQNVPGKGTTAVCYVSHNFRTTVGR